MNYEVTVQEKVNSGWAVINSEIYATEIDARNVFKSMVTVSFNSVDKVRICLYEGNVRILAEFTMYEPHI